MTAANCLCHVLQAPNFHFVIVLLMLCADPVDRLQLQLQDLTRRERDLNSQLEMLQTAA